MTWLINLLLCCIALAPVVVLAQSVQSKDPTTYPLRTYGFMLLVAVVGGVVSYYAKVRRGEVPALSVMHFIGEITTAAFSGLIVFWLCEAAGVMSILEAPLVGVAGHMGAKAIAVMEAWARRRFEQQTLL